MLTLVEYPDRRLFEPCTEVTSFDAGLRALVDQMVELMYTGEGIGIAASQVGVAGRIVLIDPSGGEDSGQLEVLINPRVTWRSAEVVTGAEGCLSMPGAVLQVPRHVAVDVEYHDVMGTAKATQCTGHRARIVQHEVDHVDGIMMIDRASELARRLTLKALARQ